MQISLILMREIVQLFIILLMGYIIVRAKLLRPEDSRSLSVVMVYLLTPCVIINAFQVEYTPQVMAGLIFSFAISIAAHILFLLLTRLLAGPLHLDVIERTAVIYTNAGILVIPLVNALLGPEYVIYSCAFIVVQQVLIWTHCRSLLCGTRGMEWRKLFLNVNIIAIVAGCALFLLRVPLPALKRHVGYAGRYVRAAGHAAGRHGHRGHTAAAPVHHAAQLSARAAPPAGLPACDRAAAAGCRRGRLDCGRKEYSDDRLSRLYHPRLCDRDLARAALRPQRRVFQRTVCTDNAAFHRDYAGDDWRIRRADMRIWQEKAARRERLHKEVASPFGFVVSQID